jgi:hypothetical protein
VFSLTAGTIFSPILDTMKLFLLALFLLVGYCAQTQSVTGSWYGQADVLLDGSHNNYLTEMVLKQRGKEIEGIMGYYFKNSYQSFFVRGKYDGKKRLVEIYNVPVVYFRSSGSKTVDCIMDFEAVLMISKIKSTLKGYFLRDPKYKYTCPDLVVNFTMDSTEDNQDSIIKASSAIQRIWRPSTEEVVVTPEVFHEKKESSPPPILQSFEERKTFLVNEIAVESDSIRITLYDNGDIDGDSVSVFYNKVPVLTNKELGIEGFNLYLHLDPSKTVNEISMFAENLGRIPPNTALMIIQDGINRHEIFMTSNYDLNGTVRIVRKRQSAMGNRQ